jgi:acyl-coenzyme A synthetase/AMP-(fatty) acid ligase
MTECCSQIATATLQGLKNRDRQLKILPHVQAESFEGFLRVRSEALLTGMAQWKDGHAQFEDPKRDGWYQTEDLCEIAGSTLVPLGRGSEFAKISGEGVNLLKLQHILENLAQKSFPETWLEFAILAVPDVRTQFQIGLASIRETTDLELLELVNRFNSEVAPFEKIKTIYRVQKIPRTALGKIAREKLKNLI